MSQAALKAAKASGCEQGFQLNSEAKMSHFWIGQSCMLASASSAVNP